MKKMMDDEFFLGVGGREVLQSLIAKGIKNW